MAKSPPTPEGRLVLTHSTYVEGLIPALEKLTYVPGIKTVTPGVIGSVKGHSPALKLRVSVPTPNGFKVLARRGKTFQEVFIVTQLSQPQLEAALQKTLQQ